MKNAGTSEYALSVGNNRPELEVVDLEIRDLEVFEAEPAPLDTGWHPPKTWKHQGWRLRAKRLSDLLGALALLVVLSPLVFLTALLVACSSAGPVIYKQVRVGRDGKPFTMYKFRTMYIDAEDRLRSDRAFYEKYVANDYKLSAAHDPRLTPVGGFLRRTSLDELAQLINVLQGTMSLVGPRPVVVEEYETIRRHDSYPWMVPGITGPWQVSGRCVVRYPERSTLVDEYAADWSLRNDLMILLRTVPAVLTRRGAE